MINNKGNKINMNKLSKIILLLIFAAVTVTFMPSVAAADMPEKTEDLELKMGDFIGTNGFFTDVMSNYAPFGFIREYHNWDWTEYSVGNPKKNPDVVNKKDGAIAIFYSKLWNGVNVYQRVKLTKRSV